jgi:mono/diheme cytochrome c family protein
VYRAYCLACHDADGRGRTARKAMPDLSDFADPQWQDARRDAELKQSILNGKGPFMLPMKDKLSTADAEQMVAFVRAFRGGKQVVQVESPLPIVPPAPTRPTVVGPPKPPPAGAPPPTPGPAETAARMRVATGLFRQYCLTCHGADGRGAEMRASMAAIPDFSNRAWQERVSSPQLAVGILGGKGTLMPAFRGRVSAEQAQDLAAYVRAFGPVRAAPPEAAASDFEQRFRELQEEWTELQKQFQELGKPPPKP